MKTEVLAKANKIIDKARGSLLEGSPCGSSMVYLFCGSHEPVDRKLPLFKEDLNHSRDFLNAAAKSSEVHSILVVFDTIGGNVNQEEFEKLKEQKFSSCSKLENMLVAILHSSTETLFRRMPFVEVGGNRLFSDTGWMETKNSGGILSNPWLPAEKDSSSEAVFYGIEKH